jgi:hypothetical protein
MQKFSGFTPENFCQPEGRTAREITDFSARYGVPMKQVSWGVVGGEVIPSYKAKHATNPT